MATTQANLVYELSTTTSTGTFKLLGLNGHQRFSSAFTPGSTQNVLDYFISNRDAPEWERGTGHMSDTDHLVRDTVLEGTNGTSKVLFSVGVKDVTSDIPALKQVTTDTIQTLSGAKTFSAAATAIALSGANGSQSIDFTRISNSNFQYTTFVPAGALNAANNLWSIGRVGNTDDVSIRSYDGTASHVGLNISAGSGFVGKATIGENVYPFFENSITTSATSLINTNTITVTSATGLRVGMSVDPIETFGFAFGVYITGISGTTITCSQNCGTTHASPFAIQFGLDRWSTTSSLMLNTLGARNVFVGRASQGNTTWVWNSVLASDVDYATLAPLVSLAESGGMGAVFGARMSDLAFAGQSGLFGTATHIYIDANTYGYPAWGQYIQGVLASGWQVGTAQYLGVENSVANFGSVVDVDPYLVNASGSVRNYRLDSGIAGEASNNVSCAIDIIPNGANAYRLGIMFGALALDTSAGRKPAAIAMAQNHSLTWFSATTVEAWKIYSTATSGSNTLVLGTSVATFSTPLVATTFNGLTITNNGTNTLGIAAGKTLTASNTLTLAGTDATVMTFPSTSATIARTDAANTFTGVQTMTSPALTTPAITGLATGSGVATANTASTLVARDASGNFSAGTITATLTGTATNATNLVIADDTTTNATMYPTWVTTTTGTLPQKISSTKLSFNPSTGALTAISFSGTHSGVAALTSGTIAGLTGLAIRSSGGGAFDLTFANSETLTAGRTLTLTLNDAARTINLGGNITTAGALITSGANSLTLTTTGSTNVTLPTSGTLVNSAVTTLSSLTSISTIGTGVWQGTAVAGLYGGTGLTTAAIGDLMYASATTPTWARLAAVASGSVLVSAGTNTAPAWSSAPSISLTNATGLPLSTGVTGTLLAAQEPAHTGDVTNTAGSLTLTLANIPTAVPMAGSILSTNIAAPSTPASGKTSLFVDSTAKRFHDINDAGTIGTTVVANTGASNQFLTAISAAGVISRAQPAFTDLSGSVAAAQMPALTGDITTSAGAVAATIANNAVSNAKAAQMANSTIKGRTTAGTGNAEDLTAAQTAAILATVGGIGKSKVLTFTRDMATASGSVAYTGMGFQPNLLFGFGALGSTGLSTNFASIADSTKSAANLYINNAAQFVTSTNFLVVQDVAANYQLATISSYDSDGFTLSWTKGGTSASSVVTFYILGIRL